MVYIQSDSERKIPNDFDSSCAMYGVIENAQNYRLTSYEEIKNGKFDNLIKTNLFVGSVEFMREVFYRVGVSDVRVPKNSNREHELITLKEALNRVYSGETLFIKPMEIKLFTGFVHDGMQYSCLNGIPDETLVMLYEPFKFDIVSEWRCYVYNNTITDIRNYSGDFFVTPNEEYITNIIKTNKDTFPIAYTIDVGVLANGENVVVEYNDMWAIGNYGIPNYLYLRLLRARYFEIIKNIL